jgi:hypothetical protein
MFVCLLGSSGQTISWNLTDTFKKIDLMVTTWWSNHIYLGWKAAKRAFTRGRRKGINVAALRAAKLPPINLPRASAFRLTQGK